MQQARVLSRRVICGHCGQHTVDTRRYVLPEIGQHLSLFFLEASSFVVCIYMKTFYRKRRWHVQAAHYLNTAVCVRISHQQIYLSNKSGTSRRVRRVLRFWFCERLLNSTYVCAAWLCVVPLCAKCRGGRRPTFLASSLGLGPAGEALVLLARHHVVSSALAPPALAAVVFGLRSVRGAVPGACEDRPVPQTGHRTTGGRRPARPTPAAPPAAPPLIVCCASHVGDSTLLLVISQ